MTKKVKRGSRRRFAGAAMTGDQLRKERQKAGLTQAELAFRSGYHPVYISELETGRKKIGPKAASLLRLSIRWVKAGDLHGHGL
jgi:transcriptional regulator with XRE-family HTH domain